MKLSLPTDSTVRKSYPLFRGLFGYFAAALGGVAHHSFVNNEKHNPGEPMHHARGKSTDHADCIVRHTVDIGDMLAAWGRADGSVTASQILVEANALAWRALAWSQELHEQFGDAPLPWSAWLPEPPAPAPGAFAASHSVRDYQHARDTGAILPPLRDRDDLGHESVPELMRVPEALERCLWPADESVPELGRWIEPEGQPVCVEGCLWPPGHKSFCRTVDDPVPAEVLQRGQCPAGYAGLPGELSPRCALVAGHDGGHSFDSGPFRGHTN